MKYILILISINILLYYAHGIILSDPQCGESGNSSSTFGWVKVGNSNKKCIANIINRQWLLGSAACISDRINLTSYRVSFPIDGTAQSVEVEKVIKSPRYNPTLGAGYDLALIRLKSGIKFVLKKPICLADYDIKEPTRVEVTEECKCRDLNGKCVYLSEDRYCIEQFGKIYNPQYMFCGSTETKINATQVANSNCAPDSVNGAPIICSDSGRWYLAAMASWPRDCSDPDDIPKYDLYTKLYGDSDYISWINSTIHPNKPIV